MGENKFPILGRVFFRCLLPWGILLLIQTQAISNEDVPKSLQENVFCPTESEKSPQLHFKRDNKTYVFVCGSVDDTRLAPSKNLWLTQFTAYGFKADGTPQSLFENEDPNRNFLVSVSDSGVVAKEVLILNDKPESIFLTEIECSIKTCSVKNKCLKPYRKIQTLSISKSTVLDTEKLEKAESHLQKIFQSALSGAINARQFFRDEKLRESLESPIREIYDKYQSVFKQYSKLGC